MARLSTRPGRHGSPVPREWRTAALIVLFLLAPPLVPAASAADPTAIVREVLDGDTIVLDDGRTVRYLGINAPEHGQPYAREATDFNRQLVRGLPVRLEFDRTREDRYGRVLAYVHRDDIMANERLLAEGWAHIFLMPPNTRHAERFLQLQENAKKAKRGMWKTVRGPLKITRIDPRGDTEPGNGPLGEFVRIANVSGDTVEVGGYSIDDREGHRYTFPAGRLRPGHVLTLVTGKGQDRRHEAGPITLYWNRRSKVWNDRGDAARLQDPSGHLVDTFEYERRTGRRRSSQGD